MVHVVENRPKVSAAHAVDFQSVNVALELLFRRDVRNVGNLRVRLDNVEIELRRKALGVLKDVVGLRNELVHELSAGRRGGVDRDDEIADFLFVHILQRFDKRNVLVEFQTIAIVDVVELVVVNLDLLVARCELAQEFAVVLLFARNGLKRRDQASTFRAPHARKAFQLDAHLVCRMLPVLACTVEADRVGKAPADGFVRFLRLVLLLDRLHPLA